jgi:hypothetical protein
MSRECDSHIFLYGLRIFSRIRDEMKESSMSKDSKNFIECVVYVRVDTKLIYIEATKKKREKRRMKHVEGKEMCDKKKIN